MMAMRNRPLLQEAPRLTMNGQLSFVIRGGGSHGPVVAAVRTVRRARQCGSSRQAAAATSCFTRLASTRAAAADRDGVYAANTHSYTTQQQRQQWKDKGEDGVLPVIAAFFGAFAATVGVQYWANGDPGPSRLLPDRYNTFCVVSTTRCNSLYPRRPDSGMDVSSDRTAAVGQVLSADEHVHLAIESPSFIAPPKIRKEDVLALTQGGLTPSTMWRILSVRMKEPSLQIERPYTPLYADSIEGPRGSNPIDLLIKRYPDGELGRYAHRLRTNDTVELRGPEVTWQGRKKDELVIIVGGTGITPAYQLINSILGKPDDDSGLSSDVSTLSTPPRISLLYAAPRASSLLLLPELQHIKEKYREKLHVELLVEKKDDESDGGGSLMPQRPSTSWLGWLTRGKDALLETHGFPVRVGRLTDDNVRRAFACCAPPSIEGGPANTASAPPPSRQVLVCGPNGMVEHVAGAKGAQTQGSLGGILGRLNVPQDDVWKL